MSHKKKNGVVFIGIGLSGLAMVTISLLKGNHLINTTHSGELTSAHQDSTLISEQQISAIQSFRDVIKSTSEGSPERLKAIVNLGLEGSKQAFQALSEHLVSLTNKMEIGAAINALLAIDEPATDSIINRMPENETKKIVRPIFEKMKRGDPLPKDAQ